MSEAKGLDYKQAGVDIDAANQSVDMIKKWVSETQRPEVLEGIGSFGGMFALNMAQYREPVLISGTDGVGTKLAVAQALNVHETVGIDLVAMCVNDILVHGAEPLFFLDYIGLGKLKPEQVEQLVKGVSAGCLQAGCALIGGETAEMPGFYREDEYDLAGFAVGCVERANILDGSRMRPGDTLIGLASTGLHSNGFSLARKVLLEYAGLKLEKEVEELGGRKLGEVLLTPTRIYVKSVLALLKSAGESVHAMAHITGGGLAENLVRVVPEGCRPQIDSHTWEVPPIFKLIAKMGNVEQKEMFRTFNMGIGFVLAVAPEAAERVMQFLTEQGESCVTIGQVTAGERGVDVAW